MIQDNYRTLQNIKQHELYYSHSHLGKLKENTKKHISNNINNNRPNLTQSKTSLICRIGSKLVHNKNVCLVEVGTDM